MVNCLKYLKIDVACYGNHEFDYPLAHTIELAQSC
jgi:2',3'-cyclic-nucleotide 2'-phosphodiesterase (5'-nucleotidase family)